MSSRDVRRRSQLTENIVNSLGFAVEDGECEYVGGAVYGTEVEDVGATFLFRNKETKELVK